MPSVVQFFRAYMRIDAEYSVSSTFGSFRLLGHFTKELVGSLNFTSS